MKKTRRNHLVSLIWLLLIMAKLITIARAATKASAAAADGLNNDNNRSGPGMELFWSIAKEEGDLLAEKAEGEDSGGAALLSEKEDEFDGGFSSLDGMLQWAIGHSDPAKLKESAENIQRLSPQELRKRQVEIKELMEQLKVPSDAQLMQTAIDDLNNQSLPVEDHQRALLELLELVEPIDNANDLHKLGGLSVVIRELDHREPEIRMISAWILGKASQNNPVVQKQILELGGLEDLMKMVRSAFPEEAVKALYAVSALIRNNLEGRELFYAESGDLMLQDLLSNVSTDIRLRKKSLFLVGDLAECQLETSHKAEPPFFSNPLFLKLVVDELTSPDLDLLEKALVAIKTLLQLKTTEASVFKDFCGLEEALERVRQQLQEQMVEDEYRRDYARDMDRLISEVQLLFHEKLVKVADSASLLVSSSL